MIIPDDKNWTWVLERACPQCGFDAQALEVTEVAAMTREQGRVWASLLSGPDVSVRTRDDRWSVLEYGCHVRDVMRLFDMRLGRILDEDDPLFANWDQDVTAVEDRYDLQDPAVVAAEVGEAAEAFAARIDTVTADHLPRVGRRSDGAHFTVDSYLRYYIHDPVHHAWDVITGR